MLDKQTELQLGKRQYIQLNKEAFMFIAFEWTKRDIKIDTSQALTDLYFEEEMVHITDLQFTRTPKGLYAPVELSLIHI